MSLLARRNVDTAGGLIQTGVSHHVRVQAAQPAQFSDPVASHGTAPHDAAFMIQGSTFVRIQGVPVVIAGNLASCGHAATGSGHVGVSS